MALLQIDMMINELIQLNNTIPNFHFLTKERKKEKQYINEGK